MQHRRSIQTGQPPRAGATGETHATTNSRWSWLSAAVFAFVAAGVIVLTPGVGAAQEQPNALGPELTTTSTCLGVNGRIDTTLVNVTPDPVTYRLNIEGLSPRQVQVDPGDFIRLPATGRPDGTLAYVVTRGVVPIFNGTVDVACDAQQTASAPEVSVINACRSAAGGGRDGFITVQLANPTAVPRPYVIEFDGVRNRSQTTSPGGAATRAVTARPDGDYGLRVRVGSTVVFQTTVRVACDGVGPDISPTLPSPTIPSWTFRSACIDNFGWFYFEVTNPGPGPIGASLSVSGLPERIVLVAAGETQRIVRSGRPPGVYAVAGRISDSIVLNRPTESVCVS